MIPHEFIIHRCHSLVSSFSFQKLFLLHVGDYIYHVLSHIFIHLIYAFYHFFRRYVLDGRSLTSRLVALSALKLSRSIA